MFILTSEDVESKAAGERQITLSVQHDWKNNRIFQEKVDGHTHKAQAQAYFEPRVLQNGVTLNLSDLLFTKDTDFLVTYNDRGRPLISYSYPSSSTLL